jgi:hypothetical protein
VLWLGRLKKARQEFEDASSDLLNLFIRFDFLRSAQRMAFCRRYHLNFKPFSRAIDSFIRVALANKLDKRPAVEMLKSAKGTAEKAQKLPPSEAEVDAIPMKERIAPRVISPTSFDFRYRDDVVKGAPLWNMFDADLNLHCLRCRYVSHEGM